MPIPQTEWFTSFPYISKTKLKSFKIKKKKVKKSRALGIEA